jgi:alpha-galactosidase
MSITVHESTGPGVTGPEFHLHGSDVSYVIAVLEGGYIGTLHFGSSFEGVDGIGKYHRLETRGYSSMAPGKDPGFSLEHLRLEYPSYGTGDFRQPAFSVERNGNALCDFRFDSYRIFPGKPPIPGLPSLYVEDDAEADTLEIRLRDSLLGAALVLSYTVFRDFPVVARHAEITNECGNSFLLRSFLSASIDMNLRNGRVLTLAGAWAREREPVWRDAIPGSLGAFSIRGASGHEQNPFIALAANDSGEEFGEVWAMSLVYSGNFEVRADTDAFGNIRVSAGIAQRGFSWRLERGESFFSPEAIVAYSPKGLGNMSRTFHRLFRTRLVRGRWRDRPRPVLANTWEACYFDVNHPTVLKLADRAKKAGVELIVLDDGWFYGRDDDTRALGDWRPDPVKFPRGLGSLAQDLGKMGLSFGIWVEPEMVSPDSDLYREHPEWVVGDPDRPKSLGRNQLVLDLSRPEVVDFVHDVIAGILKSAAISYVKWDMNRSVTEPFSSALSHERSGEFFHRYMLGLYNVLEKLTSEFPEVLFESCAGGGGRFDPGMLAFTPQIWTSDNTDAIERLKIQAGTSVAYPFSTMGAHVSASPNHQTGRSTSLGVRAAIAIFGVFGWELDFRKMSEEDLEISAKWTAYYKMRRDFLSGASLFRLSSPFEYDGETVWEFVAPDRSGAMVLLSRSRLKITPGFGKIRLLGLDPEEKYRVVAIDAGVHAPIIIGGNVLLSPAEETYGESPTPVETASSGKRHGDELMAIGLDIDGEGGSEATRGDNRAWIFDIMPARDTE